MSVFIIRYDEIGLKGHNRSQFERQLVANISHALNLGRQYIHRQPGQLIIDQPLDQAQQQILHHTFGIAWFAQAQTIPSQLDQIIFAGVKLIQPQLSQTTTFAVSARRSDKDLPFTSLDLEKQVGHAIQQATHSPVDLTHPDQVLNIYATPQTSYVFTNQTSGPGGLPVGTSGRVLCLLSGGFDSIAAAYYLARRGAQVDFLHFHIFADTAQVTSSKITSIIHRLQPLTLSQHLYLASYIPFQATVLTLDKTIAKYELVAFRRLMARVGERLAQQFNYQALVFGDSLGQVASQTLENLTAVDQAVAIPIFRPLIGTNKDEVIKLIRYLDLEPIINQPYQDCCSLVSTHPATKANLAKIQQLEESINLDSITETIFNSLEVSKLSH